VARGAINVQITGDYTDKDIKRAIRDLDSLKTQAGPAAAAGNGFAASLRGMAVAAAGLFSIGLVTDYLRDAAQAAIEDEKSMVALSTAMKNVGESFNNASAEDFISQMALSKGVADDQLRPALQRLITATGDTAKAQELLTTALDVSTATGKDLVSVSQAIGRASLGQVSALTRLGVPLDANIVKTKDFDAALASLNQRFGGQAAAAAETYGGQLARLQVAAGEAQETIGYALLNAITDISDAFGGVDGASGALQTFADRVADNVDITGRFITKLIELGDIGAGDGGQGPLGSFFSGLTMTGPEILDQAINRVDYAMNYALGNMEEAEAAFNRMQGNVGNSVSSIFTPLIRLRDLAVDVYGEQQQAVEDAEEALKEMKAAIDAVRGAMSDRQAIIDYRNALADIKDEIDKNSRSLDINKQKGRDNQEALLQAMGAAADAAESWGRRTGASSEEVERKFARLGQKVVNEFVAQGFKRKDVDSFLGNAGIWSGSVSRLSTTVFDESEKLGRNVPLGIVVGIQNSQGVLNEAMRQSIQRAINSGKAQAGIKSPSEVTRDQIGIPIIDGIIKGMVDKTTDLKSATQTAVSEALDVAKGVIEVWDAEIANRFSKVEAADAAITNWVSSTKDQLASAFDLSGVFEGSFDENGKLVVSKFQGGVEAGLAQFQWYTNVLSAIAANPGSEQLVAFLQSQGVANGGLYGQALIDNGLVQYMIDNLSTVTTTADTTAQALVPSFLLAAQDSAQGFYDQFVAMYGKDAPMRKKLEGLMDRLAKSLERTTTITVKTVYEAAGIDGKRAAGGPVTANKAYLVGERGPEVLVMGSQSGTIIPNGDLPMATGFTRGGDGAAAGSPVVINVHAGMGTDGAEVGRQVVDALKAYSRRNGPLPLAVAS